MFVINAAAFLHQRDAIGWLDRADQDKAIGVAFHQDIQHPVRAVTEINIGRSRLVSFDECARARTRESVTSLVIFRQIRFGLDNFAGTTSPNQVGSNQLARTSDRVSTKEGRSNDPASHKLSGETIGLKAN